MLCDRPRATYVPQGFGWSGVTGIDQARPAGDDRGTHGHRHRRSTGGRSVRTALPILRSRYIFTPVGVDGSDGKDGRDANGSSRRVA